MKISLLRSCLCAALAWVSTGTGAQTPAPVTTVTWEQALDAALQRAQENAETRALLQNAVAERQAADTPWAAPPSLQLDHRAGRGGTNGSLRETEVGVSWPLWLPGQRQSRLDAADAGVQAAQRALDAARLRVAGELRQTALAVAAQEAESRQAVLQVRLVKALSDDVDRRVQAGDLARADAMAARAELLQAQVQQQEAAQRLQQARQRWSLLTGLPAVPSLAAQPASATPAGEHPELSLAAANVERARRRLEAAEKSRREPPEVGVRVRRDADATGSGNSAGVSLRIPFATAASNASQLAQARSELDLAFAEEQRVRDRLVIEAQSARLQVQAATGQLEAERARAGLLRQRAELIDKSFRAGDTALPELLRALAAAAQADAAVVRQQASLNQAQARLTQSLGLLP